MVPDTQRQSGLVDKPAQRFDFDALARNMQHNEKSLPQSTLISCPVYFGHLAGAGVARTVGSFQGFSPPQNQDELLMASCVSCDYCRSRAEQTLETFLMNINGTKTSLERPLGAHAPLSSTNDRRLLNKLPFHPRCS